METIEIKTSSETFNYFIPAGKVIDPENSDLPNNKIVLKDKIPTYEEVAEYLFAEKRCYYTGVRGNIRSGTYNENSSDPNNAPMPQQLNSVQALNKLINVAKYLNGNWLPENSDIGYFHWLDNANDVLVLYHHHPPKSSVVYFYSREAAEKATQILGESEIKKALTLNH